MLHRADREPDPAPPVTAACEHVHRLWDRALQRWMARIAPGELFVTRHDEIIATILGSCVAVCVRDPVTRIGGMLALLLPGGSDDETASGAAVQYGQQTLGSLVAELDALGAHRDRLKAKLYGGTRGFSGMHHASARTAGFLRHFLRMEGVPVVAEQLGDSHPRLVLYYPNSGMVRLQRLGARVAVGVASRELRYLNGFAQPANRFAASTASAVG